MKVVNVILSILILLLAAASAVFSYFLFEKRGQLTGGWDKMASAINATAVELDRNSGTKLAGELTADAIGHRNFDALDSKLPKLAAQAKQLIIQRDALADALRRIGSSVEMKNLGNADALRNLNTYSTRKDDVINAVGDTINRRNGVIDNFARIANGSLKIRLDSRKLRNGDRNEFSKFENALRGVGDRRNTYESGLRQAGGHAGKNVNFPASGDYKAPTRTVIGAVNDLKNRYNATTKKLNDANRTIRARDNTIKQRDGVISNLRKTLARKDEQLNDLKRALGLDLSQDLPAPWKKGSIEARRAILGKVIMVDPHYGYLSTDLGKDTVVIQQIGNKTSEVNPEIVPGMELVVARGSLADGSSKFIARIKLEKVDAGCSIANIPEGVTDIQVGDIVYFEPAPAEKAKK